MKTKSRRLLLEELEAREMLDAFGVAWPTADRLKVSFAPDGTLVDSAASTLFQKLNSQGTSKTWQTEILRALQTWAVHANINLGVVGDSGQALGTSGAIVGNPSFGDIRVAARPLGTDVLALNTPYDVIAGTRAGDVVFNSSHNLGLGSQAQYDLFSVALHEAGNLLGLADNTTDPTSALFTSYNGVRSGLNAADIALLQGLYGARTPDSYEGSEGNNTLSTAATLKVPAIAADITTNGDVDYYKYKIPYYANRTVSFRVQTSGLSLLTPRLTITTASGQVVGTSAFSGPLSGDTIVTLNNVKRGTTYYIKVEGARSDVLGIGGYRLKIESGAVSAAQIKAIDATLNGKGVNFVTNDQHSNDTIATATNLNQAVYQIDQRFDYAINAGLNDTVDQDFYRIVVPAAPASGPQTLVATVAPTGSSQIDPEITVYNAEGNQITGGILVNDDGTFVVQVPNATAGAAYYLLVSADAFQSDPTRMTGNYLFSIDYRDAPIVLETYVASDLTETKRVDTFSLQVNQSQTLSLLLSSTTGVTGGNAQVAVRMNIYNAQGVIVASLTAQDGQFVSSNFYLAQGVYTMRFVASTKDGSALPDVAYTLQGRKLTDPEDPPPIDPTMDPTEPPPPPPEPIIVGSLPPPVVPPMDPFSDPWAPPPPPPPP